MLQLASFVMTLFVLMGSMHFFIYNSIQDIFLLYERDWTMKIFEGTNGGFILFIIQVLEFFELMVPLICGLYIIYII